MLGQFRCDVSVTFEGDPTGKDAVTCGALALPCTDCGAVAGCIEHAEICQKCGEALCEGCASDHKCREMKVKPSMAPKKRQTRAA